MPATVRIQCPHCRSLLTVDRPDEARRAPCPACCQEIQIPRDIYQMQRPPVPPVPPSPPVPAMGIPRPPVPPVPPAVQPAVAVAPNTVSSTQPCDTSTQAIAGQIAPVGTPKQEHSLYDKWPILVGGVAIICVCGTLAYAWKSTPSGDMKVYLQTMQEERGTERFDKMNDAIAKLEEQRDRLTSEIQTVTNDLEKVNREIQTFLNKPSQPVEQVIAAHQGGAK